MENSKNAKEEEILNKVKNLKKIEKNKKPSYKETLKLMEKAWLSRQQTYWKTSPAKRKYNQKVKDPEFGIIKFSENYWFGEIYLSIFNSKIEFVLEKMEPQYLENLKNFVDNQDKLKNKIITKVFNYYNEIFIDILDEVSINKEGIYKTINLYQLILEDNNTIRLIFDCEWDEHGIEIKFKNNKITEIGQIVSSF